MKVVVLSKYDANELATDGALHHSIGVCRALGEYYPDLDLHIVTIGTAPLEKKIRQNTTLHIVKIHGYPFELNLLSVFALVKKIIELDPQIIHTIGSTQPYALPAYILSKKFGYRGVISVLGVAQREAKIKFSSPRHILHRLWFPWVERIAFKELPIIVLTESIHETISQYTDQRIYVIPSAIDEHLFNINRTHSEKNLVVCISVIEKRKGLLDLIQAVEILKHRIPSIHFIHLGKVASPAYFQELILYVDDKKLSKYVHFLGEASQQELEDLLKRAEVFVLPSYEESFGIAVVEAMAMGIPVIATRVNGLKDVVQNQISGLLVEPHNPRELADAIEKIILSTQLSERLIDGGVKRAKEFTWDRIAKMTYEVYTELIT